VSAPVLSALEQNIRNKAGEAAQSRVIDDWQRALSHRWQAAITKEEMAVLESVRGRLVEAAKKAAGDQAVITFLNTYRNLVHQFPDLVEVDPEVAQ
jgi:hypothetical protein